METPWTQCPTHAKSIADVLSADECEAVKRDALEQGMARALVLARDGKEPNKHRTNDETVLARIPEREWLYQRILAKTEEVNTECWRFSLSDIEKIHVLRYRPRQFYRWHFDAYPGSPRKLTCVINLSPPASHWRGRLQFKGAHDGRSVRKLQGTATWCPSYMMHRATPPWWGERWTLVTWLTGAPWV